MKNCTAKTDFIARLKTYQKIKCPVAALLLSVLSKNACADEISALTGATNWINNTLVSVALTVLGMQIMYNLWQVNQGHKEWREVAKPILITAMIVAVPTLVMALRNVML